MKYQAHSDTSLDAAVEIQSDSNTLRGKVLRYLRDCGARGATDEEIQTALKLNPSTQRPRRIELTEMGFVVDSGGTRLTRSSRKAVVWLVRSGKLEQPSLL